MAHGNPLPGSASPAETGELEAPKVTPEYSVKNRIGAILAIGAATAALAIAITKNTHDNDTLPVGTGAQIGRLDYAPAGELDDTSPTPAATKKAMTHQYFAEGNETGLLKPDAQTRKFYQGIFSNSEVGKTKYIPPLREVAHMQDEKIFKPEYQNYLYTYPVTMLNNTEHPIDLIYMNYAIRATKSWLSEEAQNRGGFVIGGHTKVDAAPRAVPHTFVFTDKLPPALHKSLPYSDGVTKWYPNHTASFLKDSGPKNYKFTPWIVGTEACQALVRIDKAETIPGRLREEQDVQKYVTTFNEAAADDLDLAMQEEFCNSMGRELEAAYFGGKAAVAELPSQRRLVGKSQTPWLDYGPFRAQASEFINLARQIKSGGVLSKLIVTKGDNSPTARLYLRQEKLSPEK